VQKNKKYKSYQRKNTHRDVGKKIGMGGLYQMVNKISSGSVAITLKENAQLKARNFYRQL